MPTVKCPGCERQYNVPEAYDREFLCRHCGTTVVSPALEVADWMTEPPGHIATKRDQPISVVIDPRNWKSVDDGKGWILFSMWFVVEFIWGFLLGYFFERILDREVTRTLVIVLSALTLIRIVMLIVAGFHVARRSRESCENAAGWIILFSIIGSLGYAFYLVSRPHGNQKVWKW